MRILYHLPLSPFARKVRLALAEKRIPFELRVERVWERRPEFLELNPACQVPVLQEPNGLAIADSAAICEYLDEAYPDTGLFGRTLAERAEYPQRWELVLMTALFATLTWMVLTLGAYALRDRR